MVWNNQTEVYVKNLLAKCKQNQWVHASCERYYSKRNNIYTLASLSLTSLTGTLTFITSQNTENFHMNLVMGSLLYVTTLLTGVQTFMDYNSLAVQHKTVYKQYIDLEQHIQNQLLLNKSQRDDSPHVEMFTKMKEIIDNMPPIPGSISKEFGDKRANNC